MCKRMTAAKSERRLLPVSFMPSAHDVLCGRDQESIIHDGNLRLRKIISDILPSYEKALTKKDKTLVVAGIVDRIRSERPDGGFVRKDLATGRWIEIGRMKAREKVGHIIRIELKKSKGLLSNKSFGARSISPRSDLDFAAALLPMEPKSFSVTDDFMAEAAKVNQTVADLTNMATSFKSSWDCFRVDSIEDDVTSGHENASTTSTHQQEYCPSDDDLLSLPSQIDCDYFYVPPTPSESPSCSSSSDHQADDERFTPRLLPIPDHLTVRESQTCNMKSFSPSASPLYEMPRGVWTIDDN